MSSLPEIPTIKGDNTEITLDLFTHDSLMLGTPMNGDYGDIRRLRAMGENVLQLVVYNHLFSLTPRQTLDDISVYPSFAVCFR